MDANVNKIEATPEKLNIDLSATRRKAITVDGDENRVLYINTSDLGIISRGDEVESRIAELTDLFDAAQNAENDEAKAAEAIRTLDAEMRKLIDYIFDAKVSEVCAPEGTMFDPFGGKCRYEIIFDALADLMGKAMSTEVKALNTRIKKHTGKYVKK